jgi:PKHD-type hydroxylase
MTAQIAWKLRSSDDVPRKITVGSVFSSEEIEKIKVLASAVEAAAPFVGGKGEQKDIRKCQLKWLSPTEDTIWIYQRLVDVVQKINNQYFNLNLYGFQTLQYTIYNSEDNEFYAPHRDSFGKAIDGLVRKLTFSIQLSDPLEYEGGALVTDVDFYPETASTVMGDMICFLPTSVHEAQPVTKGCRHVLVGWVVGPPLA